MADAGAAREYLRRQGFSAAQVTEIEGIIQAEDGVFGLRELQQMDLQDLRGALSLRLVEPEPEPEPANRALFPAERAERELEPLARARTAGSALHRAQELDGAAALSRTSTTFVPRSSASAAVDDSLLVRTASAASGGDSPAARRAARPAPLAETWQQQEGAFISVQPLFRVSWRAGERDEDPDSHEIRLGEGEVRDLLERLGFKGQAESADGDPLNLEDALAAIAGPAASPTAHTARGFSWTQRDFRDWWKSQADEVKRGISAYAEDSTADECIGLSALGLDDNDEYDEHSAEPEEEQGAISRVIGGGVTEIDQLRSGLGQVRQDARHTFAAVRIVDNAAVNLVDGGRNIGANFFQSALEIGTWLLGGPARLYRWMQKPVLVGDDTTTAEWWKIFLLQLITHAFPPLLLWRWLRTLVRKQYADASAEKVALETQTKGLFLQSVWWLILCALILFRYFDWLPSFVNSEIGLNVILWAFLCLMRSEEEASRSQRPRDMSTDLGTQFLGAVDQVTAEQERAKGIREGTQKFFSLAEKIARRRAANERLSVTEHRMHELMTELVDSPQWDTLGANDFRFEYSDYINDPLQEGGESLLEFFDEMVVALTKFAPHEFEEEFVDLAKPRPGDPDNIQTPTHDGWPATKDGRYTDCLIRLRQSDVGYLRSRAENVELADKLDRRLRESEARHEDIKQAEKLLAAFSTREGSGTYGWKEVLVLAMLSAFCLYLGTPGQTLEGNDVVSDKMRRIKADVLTSSGKVGFGSEMFRGIGYFLLTLASFILWQKSYPLRNWCMRGVLGRVWAWMTCRDSLRSEDEKNISAVDEFFSSLPEPAEPSPTISSSSRGVSIDPRPSTGLFPAARYSASRTSPFPAKGEWTADQARLYLLSHVEDVHGKKQSRSRMWKEEQAENPPTERCNNVLALLKLDTVVDKKVQRYSDDNCGICQQCDRRIPQPQRAVPTLWCPHCGAKQARLPEGVTSREKSKIVDLFRVKMTKAQVLKLIGHSEAEAGSQPEPEPEPELDPEAGAMTIGLVQSPYKPLPSSDTDHTGQSKSGEARLRLATWMDLQKWWIHEEFLSEVRSLKKESRSGYKSRVQSPVADSKDAAISNTIPASLVARGIVGLSHAYAHKNVREGYFGRPLIKCIAVICALSPLMHNLILGCVEFEQVSTRRCAFNGTITSGSESGSWSSNATDPADACRELQPPNCEDIEFCHPWIEIRTCNPSDFELACHIVAGAVEVSLIYTIFTRLCDLLGQYWTQHKQMEYFSQLTPWPGMASHLRWPHFGLLPTFRLNTAHNISAWNKIRIYCCSFNRETFIPDQLIVSYVFLLTMLATTIKLIGIFNGSVFKVADDDPERLDTMAIKVFILQMLSGYFVGSILWTGMQTTRLQEHGLRHILMLAKSMNYHIRGTLYFSQTKTVTLRVPLDATIVFLQKKIEQKLGIAVAHQRIDHSSAEDPKGGLLLRKKLKKKHEQMRSDLLNKKAAITRAKADVAKLTARIAEGEGTRAEGDERTLERDKRRLAELEKQAKEKETEVGPEETKQLAWLQDMQWQYDQLEPHGVLKTLCDKSQRLLVDKNWEDNEDELERDAWLKALRDETQWTPGSQVDSKDLYEESPRLPAPSRRFSTLSSTAESLRAQHLPSEREAELSIRIKGLRATTREQQAKIKQELTDCFDERVLARDDAIVFHPGNGGPYDCWAIVTFQDHKNALKARAEALRFGLRGYPDHDGSVGKDRACHWKFLSAAAQDRWGSWLGDWDPLTGSKGVLDGRRSDRPTFSKGIGRVGIKPCQLKHLREAWDQSLNNTKAPPYLKYKVEIRDGQDIKIKKMPLTERERERREQLPEDGVLVESWDSQMGLQRELDWSSSSFSPEPSRFAGRRGSDSSACSSTSESSSEGGSSLNSLPNSPGLVPSAVAHTPRGAQPDHTLTLEEETPSVASWRAGASASHLRVEPPQATHMSVNGWQEWQEKEQLGYMLDALADVMEEERIPPNLRHLPFWEDTRPTIEVPW